jgi:hypothetical protein
MRGSVVICILFAAFVLGGVALCLNSRHYTYVGNDGYARVFVSETQMARCWTTGSEYTYMKQGQLMTTRILVSRPLTVTVTTPADDHIKSLWRRYMQHPGSDIAPRNRQNIGGCSIIAGAPGAVPTTGPS